MTTYTITGPDGKNYSIDGPAGQSQEQVIAKIQEHQQPDYHDQLGNALGVAMKALAPSWEHNKPGYSPYTPAQPGNMPNDAVNPVGNDAQMTAAIPGAGAARAAMNIPRPPQPQSPVNINQMPTQQGIQNNAGLGGRMPPSSPVGSIGNSGDALQAQLLNAAKQHGPGVVGHLLGGPVGGAIGHFAPKILGLMK